MNYPPYEITPEILRNVASIAEKIGRINAKYLDKPSPNLRKRNKIKTIHASLSIEGNTLTEEQITALIDEKRVIGPKKDVREVINAINVYDNIAQYDPTSVASFLNAHAHLMDGLVQDAGKFRKTGVGIIAGDRFAHIAPPAENVLYLMNDLFQYVTTSSELALIKSCVFHYEMEFIHPFTDGNGRMGRLWHTLLLMREYPVFEFIPFENTIHQTQADYYEALAKSDKFGSSTPFIAYMLRVIDSSLNDVLDYNQRIMSTEDRLAYYLEQTISPFTRKDYLSVFKELSTATASRDLKLAVDLGLITKAGDKAKTVYSLVR